MITCKNVATLLTSDQLAAQPWWKRLEVRLHLSVCKLCSRLARQIYQLRSGALQLRQNNEPDAGLEERLIHKLSRR